MTSFTPDSHHRFAHIFFASLDGLSQMNSRSTRSKSSRPRSEGRRTWKGLGAERADLRRFLPLLLSVLFAASYSTQLVRLCIVFKYSDRFTGE